MMGFEIVKITDQKKYTNHFARLIKTFRYNQGKKIKGPDEINLTIKLFVYVIEHTGADQFCTLRSGFQ